MTPHVLKHSFHALSLTLLSLVFPLSFLVLARIIAMNDSLFSSQTISSRFFSLSLTASPFFLHLVICFTSIAALVNSLTGRSFKPRIIIAWAVLCVFQACVSLGIEATITAGFKPVNMEIVHRPTWTEKAVFFIGLYETMMIWGRMFVRPVVDDTIFGAPLKEDSTDQIVMGVAFCALWLCLLEEEVGQLVVDAGKMSFGLEMGMDGFVSLFVGYVTVMVGIMRSVKCIVEALKYLFSHFRVAENALICSVPVEV